MIEKKDGGPETPTLGTEIQSQIGMQLRSLFDRVAAEPVPERFLALLDSLESDNAPPQRSPSEMTK